MAEQKHPGALASALPYTTVLLIIVGLYVGWTFYSRSQSEKQARERLASEKAAQNKQVVDTIFGSGSVKLLSFSLSPARLKRGESAQMCYGVSNAATIAIEPHVEDTKPSYNHCLSVKPANTTTYKLLAKDVSGHEATASLTLTVQ